MYQSHQPQPVAFKSPRKKKILNELDAFIAEWRCWEKEVKQIAGYVHDLIIQSGVYTDGDGNLKRHNLLQERTLAFLNKHIVGHGFIYGQHGENVDHTDLRLEVRVKHRINDLEVLRVRLEYADVPRRLVKGLLHLGNKLLEIVPDF